MFHSLIDTVDFRVEDSVGGILRPRTLTVTTPEPTDFAFALSGLTLLRMILMMRKVFPQVNQGSVERAVRCHVTALMQQQAEKDLGPRELVRFECLFGLD